MNVTRWFTTVINQPNVKAVIGEFALCTKMAEFDAKKFAEFSGRGLVRAFGVGTLNGKLLERCSSTFCILENY